MTTDHPPVCDYEGSDYQASFWEQGGREYEDQVEAIALQRLLPLQGKLLLELGAGAGRNTLRYQGFERIVLVDYSRTQLSQARDRLGTGEKFVYVAADIYRLPFVPGLFDAATMIRTLHHMAAPQQALQQVRQTLQAGAIFILEYANKHNIKAILRYLLRRQAWSPFDQEPIEFAALNFDFHPQAVRRWLTENQFRIERQLTVSHFRIAWMKEHLPMEWLVRMDSLAQHTGDYWQLAPSVFVKSTAIGNPEPAAQDQWSMPDDKVTGEPGNLFRCLVCGGIDMKEIPGFLTCSSCGHQWPFQDGIYDFRQS